MKSLRQSMRPCCQPRVKHVAVASPSTAHARKLGPKPCRWAPDSRDEAVDGSIADSSNRDSKHSRRLINQLLQIQSLSSLQSVDISMAEETDLATGPLGEPSQQQEGEVLSTSLSAAAMNQQLPSNSSACASAPVASSSRSGSAGSGGYTLFDDPASEDYDPLVLDML